MNRIGYSIATLVLVLLSNNSTQAQNQTDKNYQIVVQTGHSSSITRFDISGDKKHCVTGSYDRTVKLWDVEKCKLIRTFYGLKGEILGVAISKDSRFVVSTSASPDYYLKLWNAYTGDSIYRIQSSFMEYPKSVSISVDNKYIICSKNSKIEVIDLASGKLIKTLNGHSEEINTINCSPDGKYFITGDEKGKVILWDAITLSKKKVLASVKCPVYNLGFSADGLIAFCNADRKNFLFDVETGNKINELGYCTSYGDISPDKKFLLSEHEMLDINTGQTIFKLPITFDLGEDCSAAFGPDGKTIVAASGKSFGIYDIKTGKQLKSVGAENKSIDGGPFFTDDMQKIFFGDENGNLVFWNLQDLRIEKVVQSNKSSITSIAMANDFSKILVAGKDGFTRLYDTKDFKYVTSYSSGSNGLFPIEVVISPDNSHFAIVNAKYDPYLYYKEIDVRENLKAGIHVKTIPINKDSHVSISGDNKYIFSTSDGTLNINVHRTTGDNFPIEYMNHKWGVYALASSVDGRFLLSGSGDKTMKMWDAKTFSCVKTFEGEHSNDIRAVAFSFNGKMVASGSDDKSVIVWNVETGKPIKKFTGHNGRIKNVKFSPNDKYVISSSFDGSVRVWDIETGYWTAFFTSKDNLQWLVFNSDGYWDSSPSGGDFVAMVNGIDAWNIDQFAVKNNRPDLILKGLGSTNTALIAHYQNQYVKRLRKLGIKESDLNNISDIPVASLTNITTEGSSATVNALFSDKNSALKRYNIYINDVPIYGTLGKELSGNENTISEKVDLCAGQNKIEVSCINSNGVESYRALAYENYNGTMPRNLYLLAFGVSKYKNPSYNLAYAHKDALDLEKTIQTFKSKGFENVYTKVLTNEQVTPEAIKASKDFVKNAKPDDTFILFIAGHGMHDKDAEATYYYLTSNADINNLKGTAADFETIEDLLQGIPPRNKLFLMDACESGEIDDEDQGQMITAATGVGIASRGFKKTSSQTTINDQRTTKRSYLYQKDRYIYNDLVRRSGAIVFSSSKGGELSYERSDIENGLFTEYIMKALTTTEADKDGNGIVSTDELREYVSTQVAKASGDLQHPTVDRDNIYQKFGFGVSR